MRGEELKEEVKEKLEKEVHELCKKIIAEYKNEGKFAFDEKYRKMELDPKDMNDKEQYYRLYELKSDLKLDLEAADHSWLYILNKNERPI